MAGTMMILGTSIVALVAAVVTAGVIGELDVLGRMSSIDVSRGVPLAGTRVAYAACHDFQLVTGDHSLSGVARVKMASWFNMLTDWRSR